MRLQKSIYPSIYIILSVSVSVCLSVYMHVLICLFIYINNKSYVCLNASETSAQSLIECHSQDWAIIQYYRYR